MTKINKIPSVEKLRADIAREFQTTVENLGESGIKSRVKDILDRSLERLIPVLMGLRCDSWSNKWEVDHCNGRSGESAAGDFLRKKAGDAVNEWLESQAGGLPPLPKSAIDDLRKEYQRALRRMVSDRLHEMARERSQKLADELFSHVTVEGTP